MARIHKIGDPENASESKAIAHLGKALPEGYFVFHNFELATDRGMPYEYDVCVVAPHAVYHVEVKGYRGRIEGNQHQWIFENGGVAPSPIPLANKKTKVLAGKLRAHDRRLEAAFVDTLILLTDDNAEPRFKDEQRRRVVTLSEVAEALLDPRRIPVSTGDLRPLHDRICEALFNMRPGKKVQRIGLYDVLERISQSETRTVFLARHRYIKTRPQTVLKVFHFDIYASEAERERQVGAIFHDQNAIRLLGAHPNLVDTGDFFAWEADKFVLPTEYVDGGRTLEDLLAEDGERRITFAQKADIVAKVARGLAHAHRSGVVHRDIRPRNVVVGPFDSAQDRPFDPAGAGRLAQDRPGGVVKLVNFDLSLIRGHALVGDPKGLARRVDRRYAAPEVVEDASRASERSDIYSLGIVFYELMTGERPYEDVGPFVGCPAQPVDRTRVAAAIRKAGGVGLPRSPEDAASVVERMCRCDPAERYASMAEVKEDLAIIGE